MPDENIEFKQPDEYALAIKELVGFEGTPEQLNELINKINRLNPNTIPMSEYVARISETVNSADINFSAQKK